MVSATGRGQVRFIFMEHDPAFATPRTFLVVDDDQLVRWNLAELVRSCGFEVWEANNTAEALGILQQAAPSFAGLLTDIQMPGTRSGIVLANHVRTMWPHIMIIVVSGARRPMPGELPERVEFVSKPVSEVGLRAMLEHEFAGVAQTAG